MYHIILIGHTKIVLRRPTIGVPATFKICPMDIRICHLSSAIYLSYNCANKNLIA